MTQLPETRLKQLLGLAQAAHKLVSAEEEIERAIGRRQVRLLILAADATERVRKNYRLHAEQKNIQLIEALTRTDIGMALGKSPRGAVAVLDEGFRKSVMQLMTTGTQS